MSGQYMINHRNIIEKTSDYFEGLYKNCEISIQRTCRGSNGPEYFDISVRAQNGEGCHLYDGDWYPDDHDVSMNDAIHEALKGSCLINAN